MKQIIAAGSTSKMVTFFAADSSSTVGAGLTGLVFNSAGLKAYYYREGAATSTAITLATMTLGTWATGGFIVVDGTNMPGTYSLGIPDAALATGAASVVIMLQGATNLAPVVMEIELGGQTNTPVIVGTNAAAISFTSGFTISNASGDAFTITSSGGNGNAMILSANGTGKAFNATAGATGACIGLTSVANSCVVVTAGGGGHGITVAGQGVGDAFRLVAGSTGNAMELIGGASSGDGFVSTVTSGSTFNIGFRIQRNLALTAFTFYMTDSTDHISGKTGLTVMATRSLDGGAFAACANSVTEIASGFYKINLAATDTNAKVVALLFTAVGADARALTLLTQT